MTEIIIDSSLTLGMTKLSCHSEEQCDEESLTMRFFAYAQNDKIKLSF